MSLGVVFASSAVLTAVTGVGDFRFVVMMRDPVIRISSPEPSAAGLTEGFEAAGGAERTVSGVASADGGLGWLVAAVGAGWAVAGWTAIEDPKAIRLALHSRRRARMPIAVPCADWPEPSRSLCETPIIFVHPLRFVAIALRLLVRLRSLEGAT
jgi:hypothetical protein